MRCSFPRVISLPRIATNLQVADIFTKLLTRTRHAFLVDKLTVQYYPFEGSMVNNIQIVYLPMSYVSIIL